MRIPTIELLRMSMLLVGIALLGILIYCSLVLLSIGVFILAQKFELYSFPTASRFFLFVLIPAFLTILIHLLFINHSKCINKQGILMGSAYYLGIFLLLFIFSDFFLFFMIDILVFGYI